MEILEQLLLNRVLLAGCAGWAAAQILKTVIYMAINGEFRPERLVGDGGMPSAHSATVSAMAAASFLCYGAASFEFAISTMLAIIVMHDAMGVRLETGKQAKILNELVEIFNQKNREKVYLEEKLKEFVGHTPLQVAAGCALGIFIGSLMNL